MQGTVSSIYLRFTAPLYWTDCIDLYVFQLTLTALLSSLIIIKTGLISISYRNWNQIGQTVALLIELHIPWKTITSHYQWRWNIRNVVLLSSVILCANIDYSYIWWHSHQRQHLNVVIVSSYGNYFVISISTRDHNQIFLIEYFCSFCIQLCYGCKS